MNRIRIAALAATMTALAAGTTRAQTDYRNLDAGRPLRVEDAMPIEQKALELLAGYELRRGAGAQGHRGTVALTWGLLPNAQIELGLEAANVPDAAGRTSGIAGLEAAALYGLTPERPGLPALALRGAVHAPVGALAPDATEAEIGAIATRSIGRQRLHAAGGWGGERWWYGAALDRTFFRSSLLGALEVTASRDETGQPVALRAGAGMRWQWTTGTVLDVGVHRQWRAAAGRDVALTLGLTRMIPTTGWPAAGAASTRNEWAYGPGEWNWTFLAGFPDAARLFNAFDYGHAVLYEVLYAEPDSARAATTLAREFDYLTQDLLVRPPRLAVAEASIAPRYARLALRAKLTFDWAHVLHRQLYDIFADARLDSAAKHAAVERVTDYYLSNHALALAAEPKTMELMDEQYYSQVFRRRHAAFNGLIWAYHWLQVGLYEPLLATADAAGQQEGVAATLARFREMTATPASMPTAMPMTSSIAPTFTARHPRAAAIFDNLHMLHDIISDILAADTVPRAEKGRVINLALDEFQRTDRNVMERDHWLNMAEHMGGLDAMGGPVPGVAQRMPEGQHQHHE